jgi:hypothetical protein
MIVDDGEHDRRDPPAISKDDLPTRMMHVEMPKTTDVLSFIGAGFSGIEAILSGLGPGPITTPSPFHPIEAASLEEASDRRIGRAPGFLWVPSECGDQIVGMQLRGPVPMATVLRDQDVCDHWRDQCGPSIAAALPRQGLYHVAILSTPGCIKPRLDGAGSETRRLALSRMLPCLLCQSL